MPRHRWWHRLTVALVTGVLVAAPVTSLAQAALKTDRDSYAFGDIIRLTASIPPDVMPRRPIFTITVSWESERRQRVLNVNAALLLDGHTVTLPVPFESGEWQIRLYDRARPASEPIAAVTFQVTEPASARDTVLAGRG